MINHFIIKLYYTEKKKGITCNETESSKRVTDHSRVINALHKAIITDFLAGIVVQSFNNRRLLYNRCTIDDCMTIVVQRFLPENQ